MATVDRLLHLSFCLIVFSGRSVAIDQPSSITLENNEYKHVLVAMDDNVDDDPSLVQKIKDTFTLASAFLYNATKHRAVFRDVTILVPAKWNKDNVYLKATSELFQNAHIIFSSPRIPASSASGREGLETSSSDPQPAVTKAYAGCGHPGVRITLATDILTNLSLVTAVGPPEKILVHEWAKFRWGVFDEYGLEGEPQFYFSPTTGQLEAVRCTELVQGIVRHSIVIPGQSPYCGDKENTTGLYPEDCQFTPYLAGPLTTHVEASIMGHLSIRQKSKFCDDDDNNSTKHNYDAPSRHNRLCSHRSTWDVISSSEDFSHSNNNPRDEVDTTPVFRVVQAGTTSRVVVALDTSQSMENEEKLTRVSQAVAIFIREGIPPDMEVGLTTVSDRVHLKRAPMAMNTSQARAAFANELPDTESGATDLTLAITTAAQMLQDPDQEQVTQTAQSKPGTRSNSPSVPGQTTTSVPGQTTASVPGQTTASVPGQTTASFPGQTTASGLQLRLWRRDAILHAPISRQARGGHVVVVTDGQANTGADMGTALPFLLSTGTTASFVVLGGPPHPQIERLAHRTGGRVYCDHNFYTSTALTDAFFSLMESWAVSPANLPVQLHSHAEGLLKHQSMKGDVFIDVDLGNKTVVVVTYDLTEPSVSVRSPSGRVYSRIYPEYSLDQRLKIARIVIPGKAETGKWSYRVTNPGNYQKVSLLALSSPVNSSLQPLRVTGSLVMKKNSYPTTMHIFAEATRGEKPVRGLKVIGLVETPTGDSEQVELLDSGAGADIIENDGVYSRFYSKMTRKGLYTVRLSVTGHTVHGTEDASLVDLGNVFVERSVSAGYVVVHHDHNVSSQIAPTAKDTDDKEAPVRISDLRVVKTSNQNRTVLLTWTASGDDTDRDTASHYEVYMAPSALDLMKGTSRVIRLTQSDVVFGSLVKPKPFGNREFYMVKIPATVPTKGSFVFTVVAVDEAGNKGEHSNYVTVGLGNVPDVTDKRYWLEGQFQPAVPQLKAPTNQKLLIAGVLGTVSALLVIVIIATVIVSFLTRRTKNDALHLPVHVQAQDFKYRKRNVFAMT